MEDNSLPYLAEYAKSGRAACKGCKNSITKDSLRLAVMVQSRFYDGKTPNWHHFECFFGRCRPKDVAEVQHFQSLRWEDQEKIRKKIESLSNTVIPPSNNKKGKKRSLETKVPYLNDFIIGYAKSSKSKCKLCEEFIDKNELRISKKDYESEAARQYGPHERWHHVDCFLKVRHELEFFASGVHLPGYKTLSPEDQKIIKEKIPEEKQPDSVDGSSPQKKAKESIPKSIKDEMKKQNKTMFEYRDNLALLKKQELISLLEYNNQQVPEGIAKILDRLADAMTFGALKNCKKCKGQLVFSSGDGYTCTGHISEWARCENKVSKPDRVAFKVPKEIKKNYDFLNEYNGKVSERLFIESSDVTNNENNKKDKVVVSQNSNTSLSLQSLKFFIHKVDDKGNDEVKSKIKELGGKTVTKLSENMTAIISTNDELKKKKLPKILSDGKDFDIPVFSSGFLYKISKTTTREELINYLNENKISSWGSEIEKRIPSENDVAPKKSSYPNKSGMFKSGESVKKITLKDGLVVDPDSNLDKVAHVYTSGSDIYSIVLSLADIQTNRNSYYKLQILESDNKNKYWLFRAWGRIGTTIGGNKVEKYSNLEECIDDFKQLFEEKTGNVWELRKDFKKVPGKMMMLDVNYKEEKDKEVVQVKREVAPSTLHKAVQDLITLLFDIEAMKRTMLEFELDLVKMPLGKISQKQIQQAFQVLSDLQDLIKSPDNKDMIMDRTNRFYTLVPHDCGTKQPPLLSSDKDIQQKIDVLNNLMEIEIAYKLMQECQESGNSIDDHYKKLNTKIIVVEHDTDEFKFIETYVKNTHAKTHMNYSLTIQEIFKIERKGEARRFRKFMKLPNRKLLWHGSRLTNFAGILSQGLRIAPPEAPVTGYMFGKGIYFADMVSKSANYCMTSKQNSTGLLLLCEVALGDMMELTEAKYIEKLPPGNHSVKGVGKTAPDPKEKAISPSGAEVPLGVGVDTGVKKSSLLYNEYIVYDVAQVKIQYLIRMKFNHKV